MSRLDCFIRCLLLLGWLCLSPKCWSHGDEDRPKLLVIDPGVAQSELLLKYIPVNVHVLMLKNGGDPFAQIADALQKIGAIEIVHVISHAEPGQLSLAGSTISVDNLATYNGSLQRLSGLLGHDAELLFYGCDLAADDSGKALVDQLAERTGAGVAASVDKTGFALMGGNWLLEYRKGTITVAPIIPRKTWREYRHLLSHFRGGSISWEKKALDGDGQFNDIELTLKTAWRYNSVGGTSLRASPALSFTQISNDITYVNGDNTGADYALQETLITARNLDPNTQYLVSFSGGARIGGLKNNANGSWNIQTQVLLKDGNLAPKIDLPIIYQVPLLGSDGNPSSEFHFTVNSIDPNADNIRYRLANSTELGGGSNPAGVSIDANSGTVTIDLLSLGSAVSNRVGLYNMGVVVEDLDLTKNVKSKSLVDFILDLQDKQGVDYSTAGLPANETVIVEKGSSYSFDITGAAINTSSLGDLQGALSEPSEGHFTFSPGNFGDFIDLPVGSYPITFEVVDTTGAKTKSYLVVNFVVPDPNSPVIGNIQGDVSVVDATPSTLIDNGVDALASDRNNSGVASDNLNGGVLRLNGNLLDGQYEQLDIDSVGDGSGQIRRNGFQVLYQGVVIGNIDGLEDGVGRALRIDLNHSASLEGVSALVRALTYRNTLTLRTAGVRHLVLYVADQDGLSRSYSIDVDVKEHPQKPQSSAPLPVNNQLAVSNGATVLLSAEDLRFSDADNLPSELTLSVSGVVNGHFERLGSSGVTIASFTQAEVDSGQIRFVHSGGDAIPAYSVGASDGTHSSGPYAAAISFVGSATDYVGLSEGRQGVMEIDAGSVNGTPSYTFTGGAADNALFAINSASGTLLFNAAPDFEAPGDSNGDNVYEVQVTVTGSISGSVVRNVRVTVKNLNEAPQLGDSSLSLLEDTPKAFSLLASDPDGDSLSAEILSNPAHGQLSGSGVDWVYTPSGDFFGSDSFSVKVGDGGLFSSVRTVSIDVTGQNDAPKALNDSVSSDSWQPLTVDVLANDSDVDGDVLSLVDASVDHGQVSITGATLTYTATPGFDGTANILYRVSDGSGATDSATASVSVDTAALVLSADSTSISENAGMLLLKATLDKPAVEDLTLSLSYSGTATFAEDYIADTSIVIPRGLLFGTAGVSTVQDGQAEPDETIVATLASVDGSSAYISGVQQKTILLSDDDVVHLTLSSAQTEVDEGRSLTISAKLDQPTYDDVTVTLVYGGSASTGVDYHAASSVTIPAGQTTASFDIDTVQDAIPEPGESISVAVAGVSGGNSVDASVQQSVTITDDDQVNVTLGLSATTAGEGETAQLSVNLDKATYEAVSVTLDIAGSASDGSDYSVATTAVINAGQTSAVVPISLVQDGVPEPLETIVIGIGQIAGGNAVDTAATQTLTIKDDDSVGVSAGLLATTLVEGESTDIQVTLDKASYEAVSVTLGFGGTAENGSDYDAATTIVIPAGQTSATAALSVRQDDVPEPVKAIALDTLSVSGGNGVDVGHRQTLTLEDDDSVFVSVKALETSLAEGDTTTIVVSLDKPSYEDVTVDLSYGGSAALASDYWAVGQLVIAAGQTSAVAEINVVQDDLPEPPETIVIDIAQLSGGNSVKAAQPQALSIQDDDSVLVDLTLADVALGEGQSTQVRVSLNKATYEDIRVVLGYGGSAVNELDYHAPTAMVIAAGQRSASSPLDIVQDDIPEPYKTLSVDIVSLDGGNAVSKDITRSLGLSDDDKVTLTLSSDTDTLAEGGASTLTVSLDKASYEPVDVTLEYGGSAANGVDYNAVARLNIAAGQASAAIALSALQDEEVEPEETIVAELVGVAGGNAQLGIDRTVVLSVVDDDLSEAFVTLGQDTVKEGDGSVPMEVRLSRPSYQDVTVRLSYQGEAATAADIVAPQSLVIPAGQTAVAAAMTLVDDDIEESDKRVAVSVAEVTGQSAVARPDPAWLSILNDDDHTPPSGYHITLAFEVINQSNQQHFGFSLAGAEVGTQFQYTLSDSTSHLVAGAGTVTRPDMAIEPLDLSDLSDGPVRLTLQLIDAYGNHGETLSLGLEKDTTGPSVVSLSPGNGEVDVAVEPSLSMVFDEPLSFADGQGGVAVHDASTGEIVAQLAATGDVMAIDGTAVSFSLPQSLTGLGEYYVDVLPGSFVDSAGNPAVGIDGADSWRFKIVDTTPRSGADEVAVVEDEVVSIAVLSNDVSDNSRFNPASVTIVRKPAHGRIRLNTVSGAFVYLPEANFSGLDSFSYQVTDLAGATTVPTEVFIQVAEANDAPVARDDLAAVMPGQSVTIDVLDNDEDIDGDEDIDSASLVLTRLPSQGTVTVVDGKLVYQSSADLSANVDFAYSVADSKGLRSEPATVYVGAGDDSDRAAAQNDLLETLEDTAATVDVLVNDGLTDTTDSHIKPTLLRKPAHGEAVVLDSGQIRYTPDKDFNGADRLSYFFADNVGRLSLSATVSITVAAVNDPPLAMNDAAVVLSGQPFEVNVVGNDEDVDGEIAAIEVVSQPSHGSVSLSHTGLSLVYSPEDGVVGDDRFGYRLVDDFGARSNAASVILSADVPNQPPFSNDDVAGTVEDQTVDIAVLGNDGDVDGQLDLSSLRLGSLPDSGTATVLGNGAIRYRPEPDFFGSDRFSYQVADDQGANTQANVTVTVAGINDAPRVTDDTLVRENWSSVAVDLLANDSDVEGDKMVLTGAEFAPQALVAGSLSVVDNRLIIEPTPGFDGSTIIDYQVADSFGATSSGHLSLTIDTADVRLSVDNPVLDGGVHRAVVTATLDKASVEPVPITLVYGGSAVFGRDYIAKSTLTIEPGQREASVAVEPINYSGVEADKTVTVDIDSIGGTSVFAHLSSTQIITLVDSDIAKVGLRFSEVAMAEPGGSVSMTVFLNQQTYRDVEVSLAYSGEAEEGLDYTASADKVTIAAGELSQSVQLSVLDDGVEEPVESIVIDIAGVTGAQEDGRQQHLIEIHSDDDATGPQGYRIAFDTAAVNLSSVDDFGFDIQGAEVGARYRYSLTDINGKQIVAEGTAAAANVAIRHLALAAMADGPIALNLVLTDKSGNSGPDYTASIDKDTAPPVLSWSTPEATSFNGPFSLEFEFSEPVNGLSASDFTLTNAKAGVLSGEGSHYWLAILPEQEGEVGVSLAAGQVEDALGNANTASAAFIGRFDQTPPELVSLSPGRGTIDALLNDKLQLQFDEPVLPGEQGLRIVLQRVVDGKPLLNISPRNEKVIVDGATVTVDIGSLLSPSSEYRVLVDDGVFVDKAGNGFVGTTLDWHFVTASGKPMAVADAVELDEDTAIKVAVLDNDVSQSGLFNPASLTLAIAPLHGLVTISTANGVVTYTPQADYNGDDRFFYRIADDEGRYSDDTEVKVNVRPVNDPPVALDDILSVLEDEPQALDVLANDDDVDGPQQIDPSSIKIVAKAEHGSAIVAEGKIDYRPQADYYGVDTFSYSVADRLGLRSAEARVTVNIAGENDPPYTTADSVTMDEDGTVDIAVLDNDWDVDGHLLPQTLRVVVPPAHGKAVVEQGSIRYIPYADYFGHDNFRYTVADEKGAVSIATEVSVFVTSRNDAPVAVDDTVVAIEDKALEINLLGNDDPIDDAVTSIVVTQPPAHGQVSINQDSLSVTYTPGADFNGQDVFVYQTADVQGAQSNQAKVEITISAVNDLPLLSDDNAQVDEDGSVDIDVLANDQDIDGWLDPATLHLEGEAQNGEVEFENGRMRYTPDANFNGMERLSYRVSDDGGASSHALVTIRVLPVNDAPQPQALSFETDEDLPVDMVLAADDVDGDPLDFSIQDFPQHGSLQGDGAHWQYRPNDNFYGADSFTYVVSDGQVDSLAATVELTVAAINDAPVARSLSLSVAEDSQLDIALLGDDSDGDALTYRVVEMPHSGELSGTPPKLWYRPRADFVGNDHFRYDVFDGVVHSDSALVSIDVTAVNDAPIAYPAEVGINEDHSVAINLTGTDADGDVLTYRLVDMPEHGTVNGAAPRIVYTPDDNFNGKDRLSFALSDGQAESAVAQVDILVAPVNDPPVALDDTVVLNDWLEVPLDVLSNDSDVDGDAISVIGATTDVGKVTLRQGQVFYLPEHGFSGTAVIQYRIADAAGLNDSARAVVEIHADPGLLPHIEAAAPVEVDADALWTKVDLGVAKAFDHNGLPIPVSLLDGKTFFKPGLTSAFWQAVDSEGRTSVAAQTVKVHPLVSLDKDQSVVEGAEVIVGVRLNGMSPSYPLVIPYTVSGTAEPGVDHGLGAGEMTISSGTDGLIRFNTFADTEPEGIETVVVELGSQVNRGAKYRQVIQIVEQALPPEVELKVEQQGQERLLVNLQDGEVVVRAAVAASDSQRHLRYDWSADSPLIVDADDDETRFRFDPDQVGTALLGSHHIAVEVADLDHPELKTFKQATLVVRAEPLSLGSSDSDGDGIDDAQEGEGDDDGDGIPDYLDNIAQCNVLPEQASVIDGYLAEGDPGVCLRLGDSALTGSGGGVRLLEEPVIDQSMENVGGLFDFIAYGLPAEGQSYRIVFPQVRPIPANAVYRKVGADGAWQDFVEQGEDGLFSTEGEPGYCPPPGNNNWEKGLKAGAWCVQLSITDGGPNDADGLVNRSILDPGGVASFRTGNHQPVARDDSAQTLVNQSVLVDVLSNDSDQDSDSLSLSSVSARFGKADVLNNQVEYLPAPDFFGNDLVIYGVSDGQGGSSSATLSVDVSANAAPLAAQDRASVFSGQSVTIPVLDNDSDPEGDPLVVAGATTSQGEVQIADSKTIIYLAPATFVGIATIDYRIEDSLGAVAKAQVIVEVKSKTVDVEVESKGGGALGWLLVLSMCLGLLRRTLNICRLRSYVLLFGILGAGTVQAQENAKTGSWYLGLSAGWSNGGWSAGALPQEAGAVDAVQIDQSRFVWQLRLGKVLSKQLALEAGYVDLGDVGVTFHSEVEDIEQLLFHTSAFHPPSASGWQLGASYNLPLGRSFEMIVDAGIWVWRSNFDIEIKQTPYFVSSRERGSDPYAGIDVGYRFDYRTSVAVGFTRFETADQPLDSWSGKLIFHF